jgi:transketolase
MSQPVVSTVETYDCRKAFADELIRLAREDERIVAVCNDSVGSSNLVGFREEFPDRLINVGIAEQDLVGVGAGLANGGLIPFVSAAAPFLTGRALEQIKADVAYSGVHVVLCGQSPGMAYGELGPTHHSIEDLSWTRAIADLPVLVPADPAQTRAAVRWAAASDGPVYLRVPRFKVPAVTPEGAPFGPGRSVRLTDGIATAVREVLDHGRS